MAFASTKLTELPLMRASLPHLTFSAAPAPRPSLHILKIPFSSSLNNNKGTPSWLSKWGPPGRQLPSPPRAAQSDGQQSATASAPASTPAHYFGKDRGQNAIERIVLRLRNLGLGSEGDGEEEEEGNEIGGGDLAPVTGEERLGELLKREWVRPDTIFSDEKEDEDELVLPWEREEVGEREGEGNASGSGKRLTVKAPTLAELTIEHEELRRLRKMGMFLRERISIPKAGLTKEVLEKIHDKWRKEELVRLKFHEVLARDMKTAHEIVERRTGGLVIWRAGSVMVVYRGSNYEGPPSKSQQVTKESNVLFIPDVSSADSVGMRSGDGATTPQMSEAAIRRRTTQAENLTEEEVQYNTLLDGLGPRFEEWWGTGVLPVDADLLPPKVPGYKTPFRLLPAGMRSRLTNAEMTNLRKLAKSLPCHFALGRNRNHQGLATAILKLWEKSLVAKIAVKRGIQNTNNKLMAEELKMLTGGVLLLRNKYFIVIYRGKDFVPTSVAAVLAERQELTKEIQDVEETARIKGVEAVLSGDCEEKALAGTLSEFYEAQARWGREISAEEREKMIEQDSQARSARLVKRIEHKLSIAQAKKLRAQKLLAKIEASMIPAGPDYDQETITDEERVMFRRVGLRMKAYLPLGIRGVFDGVIENMHLHWKHRELVKLISKQKTLAFVEDTARLLEYESGGILVAIERVPKGFALIYYRGKNYQRPISIRPRNLLTKAKALKRSVAMQRHEALSQHIEDLEKTIEQMKKEVVLSEEEDNQNKWSSEGNGQLKHFAEFTESDVEASFTISDDNDDDDNDDNDYADDSEEDDDFEFSRFDNHAHPSAEND